jgi:hypothetical protein
VLELQASATDEFLVNEVYGEALKRIKPFYNLLDENGSFDYFKFDNYLYEYRLKACYGHPITPGLTYAMSELYDLREDRKVYLPEEFIAVGKDVKRYSKENIFMVCEELRELENLQGVDGVNEAFIEIKQRFPLIVEAVEILGYERIEELQYRKTSIEKEILRYNIQTKKIHHGMIDAVYQSFMVGLSYKVSDVKERLQSIFDDYEIKATAKSTDIRTYFEVREYYGHVKVSRKELKSLSVDDVDPTMFEVDGQKMKSVRKYRILNRKYNMINSHSGR